MACAPTSPSPCGEVAEPIQASILHPLVRGAQALGFDFVTVIAWFPFVAARPTRYTISNAPPPWQERYRVQQYHEIDPVLQWGRTSTAPLIWSEPLFAEVPAFRAEAMAYGLCHGWSQAVHDALGVRGMVSLARASAPLTPQEVQVKQLAMSALARRAHVQLLTQVRSQLQDALGAPLTARELEVLRWAADGKAAQDTAEILGIQLTTVRHHIHHATRKLQTTNVTAAVFRALALGMLHDDGRRGGSAGRSSE